MSFLTFAFLTLGALLTVAGLVAVFSGERLREQLTRDPFHRDGDAIAAYMVGIGHCFWISGLIVVACTLWIAWR